MTSSASTPEEAADIANTSASKTVKERTEQLRAQLDRTIPFLRQQLAQLPLEERTADSGLPARIAGLEALRTLPDRRANVVTPPPPLKRQAAPRLGLSMAMAAARRPRPQLRRRLQHAGARPAATPPGPTPRGLPPADPGPRPLRVARERGTPLPPEQLSPGTFEAYRNFETAPTAGAVEAAAAMFALISFWRDLVCSRGTSSPSRAATASESCSRNARADVADRLHRRTAGERDLRRDRGRFDFETAVGRGQVCCG